MRDRKKGGREGGQARRTERLVVVLKVDPATNARDGAFPLLGVAGDDGAAVLVVLGDAHGEHLLRGREGGEEVDYFQSHLLGCLPLSAYFSLL